MSERMRIYRGRVMHAVNVGRTDTTSKCTKAHPVLGAKRQIPRAQANNEDWTTENILGYPDCKHCPTEEDER